MKFFLDTANLDDLARWQRFGVVDGCTTNPALLAREGGDPLDQLSQVAEIVNGPVSAQVTQTETAAMVRQGRALAEVAPNVVVKVPASVDGFHAAKQLTEGGVRCNVTLTFHSAQAIPFARLGVSYVSLIHGRGEDFGLAGTEIGSIRAIFDQLASPTQILVASLRNPVHLCDAVKSGADVLTVPPATWEKVYDNPLTIQGQADFREAWLSLPELSRTSYEELGS